MSYSSGLYRLQQIDLQLDQAHARVNELDKLIHDQTALQEAQDAIQRAETALAKSQTALRGAEQTVQDQRLKIEQTDASLYGGRIRNPKELQDLQSEAAALKRHVAVLEDRQLEAMLAVEEDAEAHQEAEANYRQVQAHRIEQEAVWKGERASLIQSIERLDMERAAAVAATRAEDLSLYEQIRKSRRGIAVTKISSQACGACGAMLSPAVIQAAAAATPLMRCPSCSRILFTG